MKLYSAPRTRSVRVRWLLEELEASYTIAAPDAEHAKAPTLIDGELTLIESAAMYFYLADKFAAKGLAPALSSPDRGAYYQWTLFAETVVEPAIKDEANKERLVQMLDFVDALIDGREYLVGPTFTVTDLVMASALHMATHQKLLGDHPRLVDYVMRHTGRPACRKAVT